MLQSKNINKVINDIVKIVGKDNILATNKQMAKYLIEPRGNYKGLTTAVITPQNTQQIANILKLCQKNKLTVVAQGGNTGLVGGQIPAKNTDSIILSLEKMNKIYDVDCKNNIITLQAGVTLKNAQESITQQNRLLPISIASRDLCTIGGIIATNAGGLNTIFYGNTRELVLGIEVVLSDGAIINKLTKLRKDNTGYDLKNIFIGSEGTLGIITAASLRLFQKPKKIHTVCIAFTNISQLYKWYHIFQEQFARNTIACEMLHYKAIDLVLKHFPKEQPWFSKKYPWQIILQVASWTNSLTPQISKLLKYSFQEKLIAETRIAKSSKATQQLWNIREKINIAQRLEGKSLKHDISLPLDKIPTFLRTTIKTIKLQFPKSEIIIFSHVGDGNIHFNVFIPPSYKQHSIQIQEIIYCNTTTYNGSIAAEHGIGQLKRKLLKKTKNKQELSIMIKLKKLLDPNNILNPYKVI